MDISALLNPFSDNYHACDAFFTYASRELNKQDTATTLKTLGVACGIFTLSAVVGVFTFGIGGVALFRTLVASVTTPTAKRVEKVAASIIPENSDKELKNIFDKTESMFPHQSKRLKTLFTYLTDDTFIYNTKYYDLGYEDNFGVRRITYSNLQDREFLDSMRRKYLPAVMQLELLPPEKIMDESRIGKAGQDIRLANNNIYNILSLAEEKKSSELHKLLREALIYSLLKK